MSYADVRATNQRVSQQLATAPTYQAALRGQWWYPGMPQTDGFRVENLRAAAAADGVDIPAGYSYDPKKGFTDANNSSHWFSDVRVLGPLAVAASGLAGGFLGGAGSAGGASGGAGTVEGVIPGGAEAGGALGPASSLAPGAAVPGSGIPTGLGTTAATTAGGGAATSLLDKLKEKATNPSTYLDIAKAAVPLAVGALTQPKSAMDDPSVQALLQMNLRRQQRVDPLHQSVTQLSMAMLPTAYQNKLTGG